jgi:hypothetical protein
MKYVDGYTDQEGTVQYQYPDGTRTLYGNQLNDHLSKIFTQKYIAQLPYLVQECWSDYRRVGLQDSPDEIPELYRMITEEGYDLVSGWKQKRYDPLSKTLPTKLFNATARKVSGIKNLHDFNCGLKAYRKKVVKNIEVYGEMHRYIPYLAKNAGFKKIGERIVQHQARKYGTTKFGLNRFVNGYLDLISLWFLSRFGIKPMHFFGLLGSLMFLLGFISVIAVGVSKLYNMYNGMPYRLVTESQQKHQ